MPMNVGFSETHFAGKGSVGSLGLGSFKDNGYECLSSFRFFCPVILISVINQTGVKYIIVLDSNTFPCFTELVWDIGTYEMLSKCAILLVLLSGSIAPGKINQAQKSI